MKKIMLRILLSMTLLLLLFPTKISAVDNQEARYQTKVDGEWITGTLSEAINNVYDGGTIQILSNIILSGKHNINKSVTITSFDSKIICQLMIKTNNHGVAFSVLDNGDLKLQNIIIDGGSEEGYKAISSLIGVSNGGSLCLGNGAIIQNNTNVTNNGAGGGVTLINGNVVMESGSEIINCKANSGGGVAIGQNAQTFTINGGSIRNCEAQRWGGGIYLAAGTLTLHSGTIEKNVVHAQNGYQGGGGIYVGKGTFLIQGGEIKNNVSDYYGGGVFVLAGNASYPTGVVKMSAGSIKENSAAHSGGGFAGVYGEFWLSGGSITDNSASRYGGGILSPYGFHSYLSGNPQVSGNKDEFGYHNFYLDGNEDNYPNMPTWPIHMIGKLEGNVKIGISRWAESNDEYPTRIVAVPANGYIITEEDRSQFVSDNPKFTVILQDGNLVLTKVIPITSLTLEPKNVTLTEGETSQLTATVMPQEATVQQVVWSTSDESIVTVDNNGKIIAHKPGKAEISVTTKDGSHTDTCYVTVLPHKYTVRYTDGTGKETIFKDQINKDVDNGSKTPEFIGTLKREGYTFVGWDSNVEEYVTCDVIYTAVWKKIDNSNETTKPNPTNKEDDNNVIIDTHEDYVTMNNIENTKNKSNNVETSDNENLIGYMSLLWSSIFLFFFIRKKHWR